MANVNRFSWSLIILFSTVAATSGSLLSPLKFGNQEVVLNLHPLSFTIKLEVNNNDSSLLNRPWNDGKDRGPIPAPFDIKISSRASSTTPSYYDCGVANYQADEVRIVGGMQTNPNEFPWQSFVKVETQSGKISYCGGSLIADHWILTTARCVLIPGETIKYLSVYVGAHDITASYEPNRRMYNGYEIYIHPEWNPTTMAADIALIKLSTIVAYTQYIRPVCFASSSEPNYVNNQVTVAGWGTTSDSSSNLSPVLRKVTVPVISNSQCSAYYGVTVITNKVMCTNGILNRGPCNGDGGGPMIYKQPNGKWKQIGIVSFVSNQGCQVGYPYGYTRLSSYSDWVINVISSYSGSASTTTTSRPISSGSHTSAFLSLVVISLCFIFQL